MKITMLIFSFLLFSHHYAFGADGELKLDEIEGCRLVETTELGRDVRSYFFETWPSARPTIMIDDYNRDGLEDEAGLLVCNEGDVEHSVQLMIVTTDIRGLPEILFSQEVPAYYKGILFISPLQEEDISRHPENESIIKNDTGVLPGVLLHYFAKASVFYFWDDKEGRFEGIQFAD